MKNDFEEIIVLKFEIYELNKTMFEICNYSTLHIVCYDNFFFTESSRYFLSFLINGVIFTFFIVMHDCVAVCM